MLIELHQLGKHERRRWVRYERENSMSLWDKDRKKLDDGDWWIAYLDDASSLKVLKLALARHRCPREILTDRGGQFYANEGELKEKGESWFEAFLVEKGIKYIPSRVSNPQMNEELERFYGVHDQKRHRFKSIEEYVHWHNGVSPTLA